MLVVPRDLDTYPTVVSDRWLNDVEGRLRERFPALPDDVTFATFVQPATTYDHQGLSLPLPPQAVFIAVSPNPRHPQMNLMTHATTSHEAWLEAEAEWKHYVGVEDPLFSILVTVAVQHLSSIESLKQLMN